jgi:hypothetical protein
VRVSRATDHAAWKRTELELTERLTKRLRVIRWREFQPLIKKLSLKQS